MSLSLQPIPSRLACNNRLIDCADNVPLAGSTLFKVCLVVAGLILTGIGIYKLAGPALIMSGCIHLGVGGASFVLSGLLHTISKFRRSEWADNQQEELKTIKEHNWDVECQEVEKKAAARIAEFRELPRKDQIRRAFHSSVLVVLGEDKILEYPAIDAAEKEVWLSDSELGAINKSLNSQSIPAVVRGNYKFGMFIAIPIQSDRATTHSNDALVIEGYSNDPDSTTLHYVPAVHSGHDPLGIVGIRSDGFTHHVYFQVEPDVKKWLEDLLQGKEVCQFVTSDLDSTSDHLLNSAAKFRLPSDLKK